ncbi:MAG TPA: LPS assembly lipoprotein LptE [Caulobacteraceae bacterium]
MRRAGEFRARLAGAVALLAALALGGCGFTPMYAQPGVSSGLTHIDVVAPKGRIGYLLRESLDDDFGHAKSESPQYRLEMVLTEVRQAHGLNANDVAQRYEFGLRVSYTLIELATGRQVHTGVAFSNISYDSAAQPYAGIAAAEDVQDRLASDAAQKVQVQVAAWMASRRAG